MNEQRALGSVAIAVKGNLMTLGNGLYLESKLPIDSRISVEPTEIDSVAGWAVAIGDLQQWVRLRIELGEDTDVIAIRLLLRVERKDGTEVMRPFRPMLAKVRAGTNHRAAVPKTAIDLRAERPGIYVLTGLAACAAMGDDRLELLINLPQNGKVGVSVIDISRLRAEITDAARERIAVIGAEMLAPFALSAVDSTAVANPVVLLENASFSGLNLTGHVIAVPKTPQVRIVAGNQARVATADRRVEIDDGVYLACGFQCSLLDLANDEGALKLYLGDGADTPYRTFDIPPQLLATAQTLQGLTVPPKDLPSAGVSELFFFPDYTAANPYQALLYRNMPRIAARPGTLQDAIARLEAGAPAGSVIMHLHWLHNLLAGATTEAEARRKHDMFRGLLRHFIRLGGVLLWTVHNTVSHDARYRVVEIALGQDVAHLASRIHVHSASLLPTLAECYHLSAAKLVIEPHPNYIGAYLDYATREAARNRFDLPQDAKVVLFIGQLRQYKGVENLALAFTQAAAEHPDAWLLIAGKPLPPYGPGMLTRILQAHRNVRVVEGFIPDNDLQWFYRAADWVALPYTKILTSGSLMCAMSFSRPCIAPRMGMIGEVIVHGGNGLLYDPDDPQGLASALAEALETQQDQLARLQTAALAAVAPLTWDRMGQGLASACESAQQTRSVPLSFENGVLDCQLLGPAFPPERTARVAIIILNYEHVDDVQRLVSSLRKSEDQDFDIYVVDNASPSSTLSEFACDLEGLRILCIPENVGFAAGNNAALRLIADLPYEFVWILNPDVVAPPQALRRHLAAAADHPGHAIFGPTILRGENERQIASAGSFISFDGGMTTGHLYAGEALEILPKTPFEADFITGASIFLRTSALKTMGLIPEDYFLYFEETQWLLDARQKGLNCLVLPDVTVTHHKRSEDDGLPAKYYFYYYLRNALIFYSRTTGRDPVLLRNTLSSGFAAVWLTKIEARRPAALELYRRLAERALADGMAGRTGRVDLQALEFELLNPRRSAAPSVARSKFSVVEGGELRGVICIVGDKLLEAVVTVLADGRPLGNYSCDLDFAEPGVQQWSLALKLPIACHRNASIALECRLNGQPLEGGRLKVFLPRLAPVFQGCIDGLGTFICSGWALNTHDFEDKAEVEIMFEDRVIARAVADESRPDLVKKGVGDGAAGFRVRMPRMFSDGEERKIGLRIVGADSLLFECMVKDSVIAGGALPKAADVALNDLFYERHLWLARYDLAELPVGQLILRSEALLAARHAARPESELISVIMPAFDRQDTILQAVASVREQSYRNWELLIADDGSSDRTVEVVEDFIRKTGDDRIRLFATPENRGVSATRNLALQAARGEIIAYLDSDNTWLPDFLRIMAGELMSEPDHGSAYCGQKIIQVYGLPYAPIEEMIALRIAPFHLPLLENRNYIDLNCFVHRRALYESLGGFSERLQRLVDWELILRYARMITPHFVPALLSNYYFDKAANQITKLWSFDNNIRIFNELVSQHRCKPVPSLEPRPVDIALIGAPGQELRSLIQRAVAILTTLGKHDPARLMIYPATGAEAGACAPLPPRVEVVALPAEKHAAKIGTALSALLAHRRPEADLIVMHAQAMPQSGWLQHFNAAVAACPEGAMFTSRRMILAQHVNRNARKIPFARGLRDACIALPADQRIVLDPQLDTALNLMEIAQAELFCTYLKKDYADELRGATIDSVDENSQIMLMSQLIRQVLRRKIVYCGNVEIYEL